MYSWTDDCFFTDPDTSKDDAKPIKKSGDPDSEDPDEDIDGEDTGGHSAKKKKE